MSARFSITGVMALMVGLECLRAETFLACGDRLLDPASPVSVTLPADATTIILKVFTGSLAQERLEARMFQASGPLAAPVETHDLVVPPSGQDRILREVAVPVPFAGNDHPTQLLIIVKKADGQSLGSLDVRRVPAGYVEFLRTSIVDSGVVVVAAPDALGLQAILQGEKIPFLVGTEVPAGREGIILEPSAASLSAADGSRTPLKFFPIVSSPASFGDKVRFLEVLAHNIASIRPKS